jgi:hypothetical protein
MMMGRKRHPRRQEILDLSDAGTMSAKEIAGYVGVHVSLVWRLVRVTAGRTVEMDESLADMRRLDADRSTERGYKQWMEGHPYYRQDLLTPLTDCNMSGIMGLWAAVATNAHEQVAFGSAEDKQIAKDFLGSNFVRTLADHCLEKVRGEYA